MSRSAFDAHTDPLFKKLEILNLESIYKLETGKFINTNPAHLPYTVSIICFLVTRQVHSYSNRSSSSELFYFLFVLRKFSISFQGPIFLNSCSFEIRNTTSTASFFCKLKAFLLSYMLIFFLYLCISFSFFSHFFSFRFFRLTA